MDRRREQRLISIFRRGSVTYFNSSAFFPPEVRSDVTRLYAFVRVADDLVDSLPQREREFHQFVERFHRVRKGERLDDPVLEEFASLEEERSFDPRWADDFLESMEMDLHKKVYYTFDELWRYTWGSAEVIGLMMSKLMGLRREAEPYAATLGRAMQFLNFIRDVMEDVSLGRQYLPMDQLQRYSLTSLKPSEVAKNKEGFKSFMRDMVRRYLEVQRKAEEGYTYLPLRYLVPIKTASDMYKWTARRIYRNPLVVYDFKVKPSKKRIYTRAVENFVGLSIWRSLNLTWLTSR
jgi:phytoene synthase